MPGPPRWFWYVMLIFLELFKGVDASMWVEPVDWNLLTLSSCFPPTSRHSLFGLRQDQWVINIPHWSKLPSRDIQVKRLLKGNHLPKTWYKPFFGSNSAGPFLDGAKSQSNLFDLRLTWWSKRVWRTFLNADLLGGYFSLPQNEKKLAWQRLHETGTFFGFFRGQRPCLKRKLFAIFLGSVLITNNHNLTSLKS